MASYSAIEYKEATLSATFRSFFDVYSPSSAQIDVDMVNYSQHAARRRKTLRHYWSVFDGMTRMVSVYTKDVEDGEAIKGNLRSVRDRPRYPNSLCRSLENHDNALLGYVTNHVVKLGYFMENFPPSFITADVVFVPAPERTRLIERLITVCICDDSIELVRETDTSVFSHPSLRSQNIIKKDWVRRIGEGTVIVFAKVKEVREFLEENRPKETIMSYSGEEFEVDRKFAQKIQTLYGGIIPPELLHMASVFRYGPTMPLAFERYAEKIITGGDMRRLLNHICLGVFTGIFESKHIQHMCTALGSFINSRSEEGLGVNEIAAMLGFAPM